MTKAEIVGKLNKRCDLCKADAPEAVQITLESIIEAIQQGEKVELRGFGSFCIRNRRPRRARNPKTGAKVDVPAKKIAYFRPGRSLRELLNP